MSREQSYTVVDSRRRALISHLEVGGLERAGDDFDRVVERRREERTRSDDYAAADEEQRLAERRDVETFIAAFLREMGSRGSTRPATGCVPVSVLPGPDRRDALLESFGGTRGRWRPLLRRSAIEPSPPIVETPWRTVRGWLVATADRVEYDAYPQARRPPHDASNAYVGLLLADSGEWYVRWDRRGGCEGRCYPVRLHVYVVPRDLRLPGNPPRVSELQWLADDAEAWRNPSDESEDRFKTYECVARSTIPGLKEHLADIALSVPGG